MFVPCLLHLQKKTHSPPVPNLPSFLLCPSPHLPQPKCPRPATHMQPYFRVRERAYLQDDQQKPNRLSCPSLNIIRIVACSFLTCSFHTFPFLCSCSLSVMASYEKNIYFRLFGLVVGILISTMAQLLAFTRIIQGVIGDSDHLKTVINIWATACSIVFTGLLYCLGRWITTDLVWHLQPMSTARLEAGWGLRPGMFSIRNGLKLKTHLGLLFGVALMAIWGVSTAMHAWLTECVAIETYIQTSAPQLFVISRLQNMTPSDSPNWKTGFYSDVSGYGTQAMIGWENRTQLHYEDGEYFWSPWLQQTNATVSFQTRPAFSVLPKCTQLTSLDITVVEVPNLDTANITVNNSTRTNLRGEVKWTQTTELLRYYWATVLDGEDSEGGKTYNVTDHHTLFHIFGTGHASTPPTVTLATGSKPNIYIFMCTVGVNSWEIDAIINPLKVDRLDLTRKTPVALQTEDVIYVESAIMGLDSATAALTNSETIMTPIQKWMSHTKNSDERLFWFDNITEGWLENKTAECIAFMTTPITLVGETQLTVGNALVSTFILQTKHIYIIAGVSVQVALIAVVVGIYFAMANKEKFYGDNIVSLVNRCGNDWELEPLKKPDEESDLAEDV